MFQSPRKRHRISTIESKSTNDQRQSLAQPTTPTRASYLSPTKSSLARSHPEILLKTNARQSGSRGKSLRNELLNRPTVIPGTSSQETSLDAPGEQEPQESTDFAAQESGLVQRTSNLITKPGLAGLSTEPRKRQARSPLRERQLAATVRSLKQRTIRSPSPVIVPRLIKNNESSQATDAPQQGDEPELPPTPVQLGISPAPERPRGLASASSTPGGSGRHRRRVRAGSAGPSSPLKQKAKIVMTQDQESSGNHSAGEDGSEALRREREEEQRDEMARSEKHQALFEKLQRELADLQSDIQKLELMIDQTDSKAAGEEDVKLSPDILTILSSTEKEAPTPAETLLDAGNLSYLTLFSPGNLSLTTTTHTKNLHNKPKLVHGISITAPAPWLPHVFAANLEVVVDVEKASVDQIMYEVDNKTKSSSPKNELRSWIKSRLDNRLVAKDPGGIIWGAGMLFKESVKRAKTWRALQTLTGLVLGESGEVGDDGHLLITEINGEVESKEEAGKLSLLMNTTQMEFTVPSSKEEDDESLTQMKVLLKQTFNIDWTGTITPKIDITFSGVSTSLQNNLRSLFAQLVSGSKEVVGAFEAVWNILLDAEKERRNNAGTDVDGDEDDSRLVADENKNFDRRDENGEAGNETGRSARRKSGQPKKKRKRVT